MRNPHRPRRHVAVTVALTLGMAGCSGTSPETTESLDPSTPTSAASPSATETAIESIEQMFTMPLDPYRALTGSLASLDAEKIAADLTREDELRAQCMREQGFEYFFSPTTAEDVLRDLMATVEPAPSAADDQQTVAFAKQHGYGFVHPVKAVEEPPAPDPATESDSDPEMDYLESLSESDQEAWYKALLGDPKNRTPQGDGDDLPSPDDWKDRGCVGWAEHERTGGKMTATQDPEFTELLAAIDDATATIDNDKDLAALEKEWSQCMAEEGFSFAVRQDAAITVENEMDALWPRDADGKPDQDQEPTAERYERFFTEREQPVAVADATCAESTDYAKRRPEILVAFEQRFIDEHKKELDALMLTYGAEQAD